MKSYFSIFVRNYFKMSIFLMRICLNVFTRGTSNLLKHAYKVEVVLWLLSSLVRTLPILRGQSFILGTLMFQKLFLHPPNLLPISVLISCGDTHAVPKLFCVETFS